MGSRVAVPKVESPHAGGHGSRSLLLSQSPLRDANTRLIGVTPRGKESAPGREAETLSDPPSWNLATIPSFGRQVSDAFLPIQAKLEIGSANDPLEQEADRAAEQVMRIPRPIVAPNLRSTPSCGTSLHRKCAECAEKENIQHT